MVHIHRYPLILVLFAVAGCESDSLSPPQENVVVNIVDEAGAPLQGATIEGGFDWTHFRVVTNSRGEALVPKGERGTVFKTNYFPVIIQQLNRERYSIRRTPKELTLIGQVSGTPIALGPASISTLSYEGTYRLYDYNDDGITEVLSTMLVPTSGNHALLGDLLWFTTHDDGLYLYSLADPRTPVEMGHWDVAGVQTVFTVKVNLLALATWGGPLALYSLHPDGTYETLSELRHFFIRELQFRGDYLVALGVRELLVFDVSDPRDLRLVYNGLEYEEGVIFQDKVILGPVYSNAAGYHEYDVLDISDPGNPYVANTLRTDARVTFVQNSQKVVGTYYFHHASVSIMEGNVGIGLSTVAILTGPDGHAPVVVRDDYYLLGDQLVRLSN